MHSRARWTLAAGASKEEIQHALLLISSIGFPKVAAAPEWAEETLAES